MRAGVKSQAASDLTFLVKFLVHESRLWDKEELQVAVPNHHDGIINYS